ncbi:MAG: IrrE N-terminal-like domain [Ilumatobacteraceae bacterium]|nr:IrrE N-terminal-like domain [Ilumatobacteraceae bacterium]
MTVSASEIVIRTTLGRRRRRFVLAHELGHVLVRRGLAEWVGASSEERFADEFAVALLVGPVEPGVGLRQVTKRAKVEERVAAWALVRAKEVPSPFLLENGTVVCKECGWRHRGGGCACNRQRSSMPAAC